MVSEVSAQLEPWCRLPDKVVLVTGASSGLGREFCLDLAKAGCKIVAAARRIDRLQSLCNEINQLQCSSSVGEPSGPCAVAVELDVSADGAVIDKAVQKGWEAFGRIDVLINNAGITGNTKSLDLSEEEWNRMIKTNLTGTWLVSKSVGIRMRDAKLEGSIINISSIFGLNRGHTPGGIDYVSSKTGVNAMTKVMALELGVYKIRVNSISPGLFKSEITQGLMEKPWMTRVAERMVPLRTFGTVDPALTSVVRYLIHDSSQYVTGNIFIVDSGTTLPVGEGMASEVSAQLEPWCKLPDKVVLVTGASAGLGRDFCLDLAKAGCKIVAAARRIDRLRSLCEEINQIQCPTSASSSAGESGPRAVAVELDVSADGAAIDKAVQKAWEAFGRIDALINNAGIRGSVKTPLDLSEEEWNHVIKTNLTGTWLVSKSVGIRMRDAKLGGSIINISSIAGLNRGQLPGGVGYASSKSGVNAMTKKITTNNAVSQVMALELGVYKIRVNSISPGLFKSEITQGLMQKDWLTTVAEKTVPLLTYGTADPALTSIVRYLIHDSSQYVTGNIFIVDAGATLPDFIASEVFCSAKNSLVFSSPVISATVGEGMASEVSTQLEPWCSLPDKVVLVTGASSGIGREFCLDLAKAGCKIVAAARRLDRLRSLCEEINQLPFPTSSAGEPSGPRAVVVELDISADGAAIDKAVQSAWEAFGRIDALINNAGIRGTVKTSLDLSEEEWNNVIKTNLTGTWLVSKSVGIRMRDAKLGGSIINISSVDGINRGQAPGGVGYVSSKAGVNAMTKVMALELGGFKIRVNSISPGLFKSEITQGLMKKDWLPSIAEKTVPLLTYGTADPALTSVVRYLIHDSSQYVTGNIFIVDAGVTLPGVPIFSSL
ncbi:Peroxisomal hydratase-dehydrogenase-epimerase [Linum perenne]